MQPVNGYTLNTGQTIPIPHDSQIRAYSVHLVTLETLKNGNAPSKYQAYA